MINELCTDFHDRVLFRTLRFLVLSFIYQKAPYSVKIHTMPYLSEIISCIKKQNYTWKYQHKPVMSSHSGVLKEYFPSMILRIITICLRCQKGGQPTSLQENAAKVNNTSYLLYVDFILLHGL